MRLLVVEGNRAEVRRLLRDTTGATPGEDYATVLRALAPGAAVDLCTPSDADAVLPGGLDGYDGLVITGSALNIWRREPEALRQVEFIRAAFAAGTPMFGSCWGLQLATVAAGGEVARNPRGRELGFARAVTLTETGRSHPLHAGRAAVFDAPAVHGDEVVRLPEGSTVTARNAMSAVQGAEIRCGRGVFWGVQFHPEFDLRDLALIMRRVSGELVEEGFFATLPDADRYVSDLLALHGDATRRDIAWRFGLGPDVLDAALRRREIANWLEHQVGRR